jgi:hypothetical protein
MACGEWWTHAATVSSSKVMSDLKTVCSTVSQRQKKSVMEVLSHGCCSFRGKAPTRSTTTSQTDRYRFRPLLFVHFCRYTQRAIVGFSCYYAGNGYIQPPLLSTHCDTPGLVQPTLFPALGNKIVNRETYRAPFGLVIFSIEGDFGRTKIISFTTNVHFSFK